MEERDDLGPADAFFLPPAGEHEAKEIAARLVAELDDFQEIRMGDALILFIMRADAKVKGGRQILGEMALSQFQGSLGKLSTWMLAKMCGGEVPDYIMSLDADWWIQAPPIAREALVYHELLHAGPALDKEGEPRFTAEGLPIWGIRGHDIEEFGATVKRYGAIFPDITRFLHAAREGGAI